MKQSECYLLGKVQKLYSYKGAVWLYLDVDNPAEYAEMDSLFIEQNGQLVPYFIENISLKTNQALVKFEGIDTQEAAQNLLSCPPPLASFLRKFGKTAPYSFVVEAVSRVVSYRCFVHIGFALFTFLVVVGE